MASVTRPIMGIQYQFATIQSRFYRKWGKWPHDDEDMVGHAKGRDTQAPHVPRLELEADVAFNYKKEERLGIEPGTLIA